MYKAITDSDTVVQAISRAGGLIRPAVAGETLLMFNTDRPDGLVRFKSKLSATGVVTPIVPTSAPPLRVAVTATLGQLDGWERGLQAVSKNFNAHDVAIGLDYLTYARRALRLVILSDHWNATQKIAFCGALARGASNVSSPAEFFSRIEQGLNFPEPSSPVLWAHPATAVRWPLEDAISNTGDVSANFAPAPATPAEYADLSWVDGISV